MDSGEDDVCVRSEFLPFSFSKQDRTTRTECTQNPDSPKLQLQAAKGKCKGDVVKDPIPGATCGGCC